MKKKWRKYAPGQRPELTLFFNWSIAALQCFVSFCCTAKWISYICIYPIFGGFPSYLGHQRALSRFPCAVQQVLISYLFYTLYIYIYIYIYFSTPSSQFILPTHSLPPWYPDVCSLHLCLYFCFADHLYHTIFDFSLSAYFILYDSLK